MKKNLSMLILFVCAIVCGVNADQDWIEEVDPSCQPMVYPNYWWGNCSIALRQCQDKGRSYIKLQQNQLTNLFLVSIQNNCSDGIVNLKRLCAFDSEKHNLSMKCNTNSQKTELFLCNNIQGQNYCENSNYSEIFSLVLFIVSVLAFILEAIYIFWRCRQAYPDPKQAHRSAISEYISSHSIESRE